MHSPDTMNLWNQLTAYVIGRLTYSEAALHSWWFTTLQTESKSSLSFTLLDDVVPNLLLKYIFLPNCHLQRSAKHVRYQTKWDFVADWLDDAPIIYYADLVFSYEQPTRPSHSERRTCRHPHRCTILNLWSRRGEFTKGLSHVEQDISIYRWLVSDQGSLRNCRLFFIELGAILSLVDGWTWRVPYEPQWIGCWFPAGF